jgi:uncharacterized protein (TIGR03067 family)
LNGTFRVVPKIDLSGFKHEVVEHRIRLRNGVLEKGETALDDDRSRAGGGPAPSPEMIREAIRVDKQQLQGAWALTSAVVSGRSGNVQLPSALVVNGDKIVVKLSDRWEGTFTLDPSRSPRRINIVTRLADGAKGEEVRGVYELRGDELYICLVGGDAPRPASVRASPESGEVSMALQREQRNRRIVAATGTQPLVRQLVPVIKRFFYTVRPKDNVVVAEMGSYRGEDITAVREELRKHGIECYTEASSSAKFSVLGKEARQAREILRDSKKVDHKRLRIVEEAKGGDQKKTPAVS